jgi:hypothetical protein
MPSDDCLNMRLGGWLRRRREILSDTAEDIDEEADRQPSPSDELERS